MEGAKEKLTEVKEDVKEKLSKASEKVKELKDEAQEKIADTKEALKEKVSDAKDKVKELKDDAQEKIADTKEDKVKIILTGTEEEMEDDSGDDGEWMEDPRYEVLLTDNLRKPVQQFFLLLVTGSKL